jgi:hypothetical protein
MDIRQVYKAPSYPFFVSEIYVAVSSSLLICNMAFCYVDLLFSHALRILVHVLWSFITVYNSVGSLSVIPLNKCWLL